MGDGTKELQEQDGHWRGLFVGGKGEVLFHKDQCCLSGSDFFDEFQQILQVSGQSVHGVNIDHVSLAQVCEEILEFGPIGVLARSVIHKKPIQFQVGQLSFCVLTVRADANVTKNSHNEKIPLRV